MKATKHCQIRQQQRHISDTMIQLTLSCGRDVKNTDKITLLSEDVDELYSSLQNMMEQLRHFNI